MSGIDYGDTVRIRHDARAELRPGSYGSVCGFSDHAAHDRTVTVEFVDGSDAQVPIDLVEPVDYPVGPEAVAQQFVEIVGAIEDAVWAGVLLPEHLPSVATDLMAYGADTPTLRLLAGLDLTRFDPRDATDLLNQLVTETQVPDRTLDQRIGHATMLLARAASRLEAKDALDRFSRLWVTADYPISLQELAGLHDEWIGGWGRLQPQIEAEVRRIASDLDTGVGWLPEVLIDSVVASR